MPKCNDPKTRTTISDNKMDSGLRSMVALPVILLCLVSCGIVLWATGNLIVTSVILCATAVIFFWALKPSIATPEKFPISISSLAIWFIILFAIIFANTICGVILADNGINWGEELYKQTLGKAIETPGLIALFAGCIFGPVAEELIFRGVLFGWMSKRFPVVIAAIISSLLFGLSHMTAIHLITATTFGLFLCAFYARFGRLWMCCAIHCAYNFCLTFFAGWFGAIVLAGLCICGFIALISWLVKNSDKMALRACKPSKVKTFMDEAVTRAQEKKQVPTEAENAAS